MKKYWTVFKISWTNVLTYRFNFLIGQLRNIFILLLLYYIWEALSYKTGRFAGYTAHELTTYVFLIMLLKSTILGTHSSNKVAEEINNGFFSKYLCMPIKYPVFVFFRELAERAIYLIVAFIEVFIFSFILKANLFFQKDFKILFFFISTVFLAQLLYFIMNFCVSLLAFWSREANGAMFLFRWILEFASGEFYPLDILSHTLFLILAFLPFAYVLFYPVMVYLGRITGTGIIKIFGMQILWIAGFAGLAWFMWFKGTKKYSGEGM